MGDVRAARQKRYLQDLLHDKAGVELKENTSYLDAICAHPDPVDIVSRVISSKKGLSYIAQSMRFSFSATFLNGTAATFLHYIQHQDLVTISSGAFLRQILLAVAQPPVFFNAFKQAFCDGVLNESAETSFGWMLFQLISSLPTDESEDFLSAAKDDAVARHFASSQSLAVRTYGQKIKHYVDSASIPFTLASNGPGGRHDNDFIDFREIVIRPTPDEIASTTLPFLRLAHELSEFPHDNTGLALHLDNQFRLLREDMLHDMREELKMIQSPQKNKGKFRRGFPINGLALHGAHLPTQPNSRWGVSLRALTDLSQFKGEKRFDKRLAILKDNKKIMRHGSLACLLINNEIVAFPTITRDEDLLAGRPPIVVLAFEGRGAISSALARLKAAIPAQVTLVQVDTAIFSYEPVLQALQNQRTFNLADKLLAWTAENSEQDEPPWSAPAALVPFLLAHPSQDVRQLLGLTAKDPVRLDFSQMKALVSGLNQRLSLIQGPPGTGKSFIGSLITKVLHARTNGTILVVCYTNHALDQFIDDLCKIGIPQDDVVRIGKANPAMKRMSLYEQKSNYKFKRADWTIIDGFKADSAKHRTSLQSSFKRYMSFTVSLADLLVYLEDEEPAFANAFEVIPPTDGMTQVGKGKRKVEGTYLLENWRNGWDARPCKAQSNVIAAPQIWNMAKTERQRLIAKWEQQLFAEEVDVLSDTADQYNKSQAKVDRHFSETDANVLRSKRIIACTTTGAAKYIELIQRAAQPDIVVVEEAGEILESHVLTALAPDTKQLVLIGDHKQLRPKVDNYRLTVEKGDGFDLNRSLFERLVLSDFPHETLLEQHRMRPEISSLVRDLTYPDLKDAPKTFNRPSLRGLQNDIVFISHTHPEDDLREVADRRDQGAPSSKQNTHEAQMVLKIVRYLGQQGYGTENIVILTPYLGQLYKLIDALKSTTDPVLNDLDSYDLVRAGLIPAATAKLAKKSIRIATIDNYQGEESDIVIASLTRSNERKDIGFMAAPERVNVLLSRARLGLILIGNVDTFSHSRKGGELWQKLFGLLRDKAAVFEGLPVQCERHPARKSILSDAKSFDELCPEGGCLEICGAPLNCSLHTCQSSCHQLADHSKLPCNFIYKANCPKGHRLSWKCSEKQPICHACERERKRDEKAQQKEFEREQEKEKERVEHERKITELDEQIKAEQAKIRDQQLEADRQQALEQKKQDLKDVAARAQIRTPRPPAPIPTTPKPAPPSQPAATSDAQSSSFLPLSNPSPAPTTSDENEDNEPEEASPSESEWIRLKTVGGESNDALDGIMGMTGLEEVKEQVMSIKVKIETARRQGISGNTDRLNVAMLGNPGTGKTTIARLYAKFLSSVGALPGSHFEETTGSKLGSEGVDGAKKLLATVQNAGGGVIFIDEAYQLTSQSNFGGRQVLDFLLAEMENNTGKIVFIVAGYRKQMESFFEHNPGIPSRVPYQMQFQDYSDKQLRCMLRGKIEKKWGGKMKVEGGLAGLFMRIVARRLGRGRGQEGFGNARALENVLASITERQAKRLDLQRRAGNRPDDFLLSREDLIGPEPSQALLTSDAWRSLQSMIGLESVKDSITSLCEQIQDNYQRELRELKPVETSLNKVFSGSPGTGKTTVAKLYGQILAEIGLLSNGEVVVKNPSDFIGSALGQSEEKTRGILESTRGKILIIDEAYMLYQASGSGSSNVDPYRTAVVDTLVAEVQNVPGDDRCVLLAGYKSEMEQMFQNVNPGLARRFDMENAFEFHDFSDAELRQILDGKLKAQELDATDSAKDVAIRVLGRERNRPNFGNAGAVDLILTRAKGRYKQRKAKPTAETNWTLLFEPQDFDPDFDRDTTAESSIDELFADIVGCDTVKQKLKQFTKLVQLNRLRGAPLLSQIPTSFVFKGPPGTGKTTVARKIGQVFYNMNFLSSTEVLERSAKDLVGQYVGQTAPKVAQLFDEALGRVLFIDEAYRLAEGHFAKEAMDEIVALMTNPKYKGNLIVILAGYDEDMNRLLSVNPGLASRFPEEILFENMRPQDCLNVLFKELDKEDIEYPDLTDSNSSYSLEISRLLRSISSLSSWGNARDIKTLAQRAIQHVLLNASSSESGLGRLVLTGDTSVRLLNQMYEEQAQRANIAGGHSSFSPQPPIQLASPPDRTAPSIQTTTATSTVTEPPKQQPPPDAEIAEYPLRDAGVSEEDWQRLQAGREAEKKILADAEASRNTLLAQILKANKEAAAAEREEKAAEAAAIEADRIARSEKQAVAAAEEAERKRKLEELRLKALKARAEQEKIRQQLEAQRAEEERRRKEEAKVQAKLREMGVCVAGFRWIKVAGGYQCGGGSHFASNAQLGI